MGEKASIVTEAQIQMAICELLSTLSRQHQFAFHSIPNEALGQGRDRKRNAIRMARLKKMGLTPGAADLEIVYQGRAYYIEIKRPGERQTENQKIFMHWARDAGARYIVVTSPTEVLIALKKWGIA
tara:strand:- start:2285 stop:2662 length:378 start_codon:yes stop_codon:yes gene_type:complete